MEKKPLFAAACLVLIASMAMPVAAHPHKESASGDTIVNTVTHDHAGGVSSTSTCMSKKGEKETSSNDCTVSPVSTH
ncbi:hypothetical protein LRP50_03205 [Enterovibrio sp. ZSDZ42]|uniref:DUF680 domain-containing protein n=1 Tax=Enterovibrio gelatinilyticus TaxID=2899819 RepID=A0ABT5QVS6_9GAMM|nr:hypothetical protein [Enterovibrio sp. ZSDZ42]MDD1792128.1 hypothetical protein [Enterovibrio sp. ZSDZ42]